MSRKNRLVRIAAVLLLGSLATWGAPGSFPQAVPAAKAAYSAEQVTLTTPDGARLNGVFYRPAGKPRQTAILLVHGFGGNFYNEYFPLLAQAAAEQGYPSLAVNMRDHDAGPKTSDFVQNEADIGAGRQPPQAPLVRSRSGDHQRNAGGPGRRDRGVEPLLLGQPPGDQRKLPRPGAGFR